MHLDSSMGYRKRVKALLRAFGSKIQASRCPRLLVLNIGSMIYPNEDALKRFGRPKLDSNVKISRAHRPKGLEIPHKYFGGVGLGGGAAYIYIYVYVHTC